MAASGLTRLARIPGVSAFIDIVKAIGELRGYLRYLSTNLDRDTNALVLTAFEVKTFLRRVGIRKWSEYWHYGRQLISLQHRLFYEQVYSDMGEPWSELVTGFGPLRALDGGSRDEGSEAWARTRAELGIDFQRAKRRIKRKYPDYESGGGGFLLYGYRTLV